MELFYGMAVERRARLQAPAPFQLANLCKVLIDAMNERTASNTCCIARLYTSAFALFHRQVIGAQDFALASLFRGADSRKDKVVSSPSTDT